MVSGSTERCPKLRKRRCKASSDRLRGSVQSSYGAPGRKFYQHGADTGGQLSNPDPNQIQVYAQLYGFPTKQNGVHRVAIIIKGFPESYRFR